MEVDLTELDLNWEFQLSPVRLLSNVFVIIIFQNVQGKIFLHVLPFCVSKVKEIGSSFAMCDFLFGGYIFELSSRFVCNFEV